MLPIVVGGSNPRPPQADINYIAFQSVIRNPMQHELRYAVVAWMEFFLGKPRLPEYRTHRISCRLP